MRICTWMVIALGAWLAPNLSGAEAATPAATPEAVIDELQGALINSMHSQPCAARRKRLEPVLTQDFDFDAIAQKLLRRHWKELNDDQRARMRTVVAQTAITLYATQFVAEPKDQVKFSAATVDPANENHVSSQLIMPDVPAVPFEYTLAKNGDQWKVINVVVQGVSDLAVRSAQDEAVIARSGADELLKELEQKNSDTKAACLAAS